MPDIGLLQGSRPRTAAPPSLPTPPVAPVHEVAAPFIAPIGSAIAVMSDVAGPAAPDEVVSVPVSDAASGMGSRTAAETPARSTAETPVQSPAGGRPVASRPANPSSMRASDLLWLALALFIIVGTGLGMRDPWPADEPRFAALARDMALSQEWLFPRVGGDLYQDKPPLYFWLLALCYSLFGSVKASFLIPSFLAAGGILFLIYDFGRRTVGREAGLAAALITVCTLQFVTVTRGAQIDATLCFLTTLSLCSLLRHLLLGPAWGWYFIGGFAAGLGVFTKGVGFLPVLVLIPYAALRLARWQGLAAVDGGTLGWRWWLAPLAMLCAISLWFVPMLIAVATSGSPEYAAYRDEILFKQTVGRYAAAWHHVKPWYYFLVEVIPALWLPWSLLLFWLVPRFKAAFHERNARVWLPLLWVTVVVLFFSWSPGKRGIYVFPALPALAIAALPFLGFLLARPGEVRGRRGRRGKSGRRNGVLRLSRAVRRGTPVRTPACAAVGVAGGYRRAGRRVLVRHRAGDERRTFGRGFRTSRAHASKTRGAARAGRLQGDRPTVNFGHRRGFEGAQESYDAAAWLNAKPDRVLLVPANLFENADSAQCFTANSTLVGVSSREEWFLVRAPAADACASKGQIARAIEYSAAGR
jgi:hypothetical protein